MHWQNDGPEANRGTILVASGNALFASIVGEMVAHCGFFPAFPGNDEASRLSLARTQPRILICDCAAPGHGVRRLIADASSRHIPLVLSDLRIPNSDAMRGLVLNQSVAWLTFPISRSAFGMVLEGLLPPFADGLHTVSTSIARITIAAAVSVRLLPRMPAARNQAASRTIADVVDRVRGDRLVGRAAAPELADVADPRSTLVAALAAKPVYDQSLRVAVWTYARAERYAGVSPGRVIMALTELVDAARIVPASVGLALTRRAILWCVDAYFGQLRGDTSRPDDSSYGDAPRGAPTLVSNR